MMECHEAVCGGRRRTDCDLQSCQPCHPTRVRIFFTPVNVNYPEHNEAYGLDTDFTCAREQIKVGQTTSCTVGFTAPAREIQDSFWQIGGLNAAAWPGQKP